MSEHPDTPPAGRAAAPDPLDASRPVPQPRRAAPSDAGLAPVPGGPVPAIELQELTKDFGRHHVLDRVSLSVEPGSIYGFLGVNGAGKTTTIRILLGLARPSSGRALVLGHELAHSPADARAKVAFAPDVPAFPAWMRAEQYLRFVASTFSMSGTQASRRTGMLLEVSGLAGVRQPIGAWSRGMKQRLGIAQALVNSPEVIVCDEPTSALDPLGRKDVLDMISALSGRATVFFSTHVLTDVERVCDHLAVLDRGRLVAEGGVEQLKAQHGSGRQITVELTGLVPGDDPARELAGLRWCQRVVPQPRTDLAPGEICLLLGTDDELAAAHDLPALATRHGWGLRRVEPRELSLEEVFVDIVHPGAEEDS